MSAAESSSTADDSAAVINPHRRPDEKAIFLPPSLSSRIKPHQLSAIRFLWKCVVIHAQTSDEQHTAADAHHGCIIAHAMGLGKTLTAIAFISLLKANTTYRHILVLTPVNVMLNWQKEIAHWMPQSPRINRYFIDDTLNTARSRIHRLSQWADNSGGGICVMGFEQFRLLCAAHHRPTKQRERVRSYLLEKPDVLIVDEGHRIKNAKSALTKTITNIRTRRRIILTGTPIQNNLMEYYEMIHFVRPGLLGSVDEFKRRFETLIKAGQCIDSSDTDIRIMKQRSYVLHQKLKEFVHRKDYTTAHRMTQTDVTESIMTDSALSTVHTSPLPPKHEYVLFIQLSPLQRRLYRQFTSAYSKRSLFKSFHACSKIVCHPDTLLIWAQKSLKKRSLDLDRFALDDFIVDDESDDDDDEDSYTITKKRKRGRPRKTIKPKKRIRIGVEAELDDDDTESDDDGDEDIQWFQSLLGPESGYESGGLSESGKMIVMCFIVQRALMFDEKVLIFTQSLVTIDLIESIFSATFGWRCGSDYYRLDGSTPAHQRQNEIDEFNRHSSPQKVYLISTRAGCLGVNLIGASRVIMFDVSWNPSNDLQAIFRSYRYGQNKPVSVYRLVANATMEHKIFALQVQKQGLSLIVVDKKDVKRETRSAPIAALWEYDDSEAEDDKDEAPVDKLTDTATDSYKPEFAENTRVSASFSTKSASTRANPILIMNNAPIHDLIMVECMATFAQTNARADYATQAEKMKAEMNQRSDEYLQSPMRPTRSLIGATGLSKSVRRLLGVEDVESDDVSGDDGAKVIDDHSTDCDAHIDSQPIRRQPRVRTAKLKPIRYKETQDDDDDSDDVIEIDKPQPHNGNGDAHCDLTQIDDETDDERESVQLQKTSGNDDADNQPSADNCEDNMTSTLPSTKPSTSVAEDDGEDEGEDDGEDDIAAADNDDSEVEYDMVEWHDGDSDAASEESDGDDDEFLPDEDNVVETDTSTDDQSRRRRSGKSLSRSIRAPLSAAQFSLIQRPPMSLQLNFHQLGVREWIRGYHVPISVLGDLAAMALTREEEVSAEAEFTESVENEQRPPIKAQTHVQQLIDVTATALPVSRVSAAEYHTATDMQQQLIMQLAIQQRTAMLIAKVKSTLAAPSDIVTLQPRMSPTTYAAITNDYVTQLVEQNPLIAQRFAQATGGDNMKQAIQRHFEQYIRSTHQQLKHSMQPSIQPPQQPVRRERHFITIDDDTHADA